MGPVPKGRKPFEESSFATAMSRSVVGQGKPARGPESEVASPLARFVVTCMV